MIHAKVINMSNNHKYKITLAKYSNKDIPIYFDFKPILMVQMNIANIVRNGFVGICENIRTDLFWSLRKNDQRKTENQ